MIRHCVFHFLLQILHTGCFDIRFPQCAFKTEQKIKYQIYAGYRVKQKDVNIRNCGWHLHKTSKTHRLSKQAYFPSSKTWCVKIWKVTKSGDILELDTLRLPHVGQSFKISRDISKNRMQMKALCWYVTRCSYNDRMKLKGGIKNRKYTLNYTAMPDTL